MMPKISSYDVNTQKSTFTLWFIDKIAKQRFYEVDQFFDIWLD